MKKFIISGVPRSGTNRVCQILSEQEDINIWSGDDGKNWEPMWNPHHGWYDEEKWTRSFIEKNQKSHVGFKKFSGDNTSVKELASAFDMKMLPVIRKDLVANYLSYLILKTKLALGTYGTGKSPGHGSLYSEYDFDTIMKACGGHRRLVINAFYLLKQHHYWHNTESLQKIYFEDMINGVEYQTINDFFGKNILFSLNGYKPMQYEHYSKDWEMLMDPLKQMLYNAKKTGEFPEYINKCDI